MEASPWRPLAARPGWSHRRQEPGSVPAIVFDHVVEFNDVLPLFVLLAALEGLFLKGGERLSCLELGPYQKEQGLGNGYDLALFNVGGNCDPGKPNHLPIDTELVKGRAGLPTDSGQTELSESQLLFNY